MKHLLLAGVAALGLALPVLAVPGAARAQLLLSANDNKVVLENGVVKTLREPQPDTLAVFDLSTSPPTLRAEIAVAASVVGPPTSIAITPDEKLALVTANQRPNPAEPGKLLPGNTMAVIDLGATPPRLQATLPTGAAPAGVSINRAGTLALVANRAEGTVSVYRIAQGQVTPTGKVDVGTVGSEAQPCGFTPDGRFALVTRNGDHMLNVLQVEGEKVTKLDREITTGVRPYEALGRAGRALGGGGQYRPRHRRCGYRQPGGPDEGALPHRRHHQRRSDAGGHHRQPGRAARGRHGDERLQQAGQFAVLRARSGEAAEGGGDAAVDRRGGAGRHLGAGRRLRAGRADALRRQHDRPRHLGPEGRRGRQAVGGRAAAQGGGRLGGAAGDAAAGGAVAPGPARRGSGAPAGGPWTGSTGTGRPAARHLRKAAGRPGAAPPPGAAAASQSRTRAATAGSEAGCGPGPAGTGGSWRDGTMTARGRRRGARAQHGRMGRGQSSG
ncbi:YncE family protein [Dankookia sp. P2]|uniref:YncE family protein n=1 Tax=Dankookia sp. P2 TaxID=3423955 RepID=UPI003D67E484